MDQIFGMPLWVFYSIIAVVMTYVLSAGGWALAKAGRNPLWVLLLLFPWLSIIGIWLFAYVSWPAMAAPAAPAPEHDDTDTGVGDTDGAGTPPGSTSRGED